MKIIVVLLGITLLAGCAKVTIRPDGLDRVETSEPDFEKSYPFIFFGLVGEAEVNVKKICGSSDIEQLQSLYTGLDQFFFLITVGLYSPKTARVWCKGEGDV